MMFALAGKWWCAYAQWCIAPMALSDVMCSLLMREAHSTRRSRHHARSAHHLPRAEHIVPKTKKQPIGLLSFLVAEMGFEPHDLRVMSPTSCQTAPLRDIMVPEAGVEPVREKISRDFKSRASANSAIPANATVCSYTLLNHYTIWYSECQAFFQNSQKTFAKTLTIVFSCDIIYKVIQGILYAVYLIICKIYFV